MDYYQISFSLSQKAKSFEKDLLKNDLLSIGFDAFVDIDERSFEGYCPKKDFSEESLKQTINNSIITDNLSLRYDIKFIKDENWNQKWEETSSNVQIGNFCNIRKSTQPQTSVIYDIIINPKQSFGTANHPTTYMIIEYLSTLMMKDKSVMDMGCGTAVLGILCKKMGAKYVECIDIDDWAYNNAIENREANNVDIVVKKGSSEEISKDTLFDLFIANINLNILLENIKYYAPHIKENGLLVLSGFYEQDTKELIDTTKQYGLTFHYNKISNEWSILVLRKVK